MEESLQMARRVYNGNCFFNHKIVSFSTSMVTNIKKFKHCLSLKQTSYYLQRKTEDIEANT